MAQRFYPDQAPDQGTFTLTGAGSTNDVFTLTSGGTVQAVRWVVENPSNVAGVYVDSGHGASHGATPGNEPVTSTQPFVSDNGEYATWLAVYGPAGAKVNAATAGGLIIYAEL
jgi:hypothetical protein